MPRIEGREPSRKTFPVERLAVGSFIFHQEEWLWRKPCCVTGCDHRMGPKTDEPGWATKWKSCDEGQLPGHAYLLSDDGSAYAGMVCPCHVAVILDRCPGCDGSGCAFCDHGD